MKKLNWLDLNKYLADQNMALFTTRDIMLAFGTEKRTTEVFLFNYVNKGVVVRLKAGLFALVGNLPHEFVMANRMCIPSYVSLDSAMAFHKIIPETVYGITSITSKATKEYEVKNLSYTFNKIKKEAFCGYGLYDTGKGKAYIATAEKAVADYMYFVKLGKRSENDRIDWSKIDKKLFKEYEKLL